LKTKAWLNAFRLRTLPLAVAVIIAGTAISFMRLKDFVCDDCPEEVYLEHSWHKPSLLIFFLILLTTIFLQILSNLANDYGDFVKGTDNKERVGPERAMQGGLITKKEMFRGIMLFAILSFISGLCLLYFAFTDEEIPNAITFIGIGVLCIVAAIKYTMGKNAYGYNALGDVAVIVFFGGIGILGTQYLQSKIITIDGIYMAIAFGFWSAAVLNLNNMRDVDNDVAHKKFTLAYYFGFTKSKIYQAKLVIIPYIFTFLILTHYMSSVKAFCALALLPLSLMMLIAIIKVQNRKDFDKFLKIQALLTLLNSIVLFTCIYLLHA
jgi:1,4-dihydroxy-2-naphthoate polyprenyltransferase